MLHSSVARFHGIIVLRVLDGGGAAFPRQGGPSAQAAERARLAHAPPRNPWGSRARILVSRTWLDNHSATPRKRCGTPSSCGHGWKSRSGPPAERDHLRRLPARDAPSRDAARAHRPSVTDPWWRRTLRRNAPDSAPPPGRDRPRTAVRAAGPRCPGARDRASAWQAGGLRDGGRPKAVIAATIIARAKCSKKARGGGSLSRRLRRISWANAWTAGSCRHRPSA